MVRRLGQAVKSAQNGPKVRMTTVNSDKFGQGAGAESVKSVEYG